MGPAAVLAILFHYRNPELGVIKETLWAFSIYLEAVAILPQLFMLQRTGEAETITTHYLFALGAYRALYIPNWIYRSVLDVCLCSASSPRVSFLSLTWATNRYFTEKAIDPISILAGLVQTGLYLDFFYSGCLFFSCQASKLTVPACTVYFTKVMKGEKFELPA